MTKTPRLRVYWLPNVDGLLAAVVAAPNQKVAAELIGSSFYSFKTYGGQITSNPTWCEFALAQPGVVFYRPIDADLHGGDWTSDYREALRAAKRR